MKKFSVLLTLAVLMVSSSVFAGSWDYLSNQSAKYIMNTASQARTEGADIVAYNPAGTALMGEGFFIDVSNQTLLKYYTGKEDVALASKGDLEQEEPTLLLPNVYVVYNAGQVGVGKLAAYGQMGVVAGGGKLIWDDGSVGSNMFAVSKATAIGAGVDAGVGAGTSTLTSYSTKAEASSVYYAFGGGVAYSFLEDMLSLSAGVKYVMAERMGKVTGALNYTSTAIGPYSITVNDEYEYDAKGYTFVFGFDVRPMKELTIGARYEMETDLEFKYKQKTLNSENTLGSVSALLSAGVKATVESQLPDYEGVKANQNLPQILSFGAEYVVMPELAVSAGSNIYFMSKADMEDTEKMFGTGWEVSLGAVYKVIEPLKVGATFTYTDQGVKEKFLKDDDELLTTTTSPILDSLMFGLGATYTVIPNLDLTVAGNWVHYLPEEVTTDAGLKVTTEKELYTIAIGVGYKI